MPDYTLSAKITGDSSGFDKAIQSAEKTASSFEKRMESISSKAKSIGDKLSGIGTVLTVGVTTPLAVAGKSMVDAASDFDENLNKISVAFGDSADDVKAWADTATESFGLSMNQALEATSLFGDMATSMGISQSEAASMSTSLAGLAGDMASFKNIGIDEAMTALNGVFTGETESLKQLGIVMTEVNLQEFADGLGLVYDDMTQAEKVQLRYNYVMAMSKNAIGDYARTSDGTANSMRTFQASVENLAITLGQNLLPIVTPIIQKATEMVNAFSAADPELQRLILGIAGIAAAAGPALIILGGMVSGFGSLVSILGAVLSPIGLIITAIAALSAGFVYLMNTNEQFRDAVLQVWDSISLKIQSVRDIISEIGFSGIFSGIISQLQTFLPSFESVFNTVKIIIGTVADAFSAFFSGLAGSFSGGLDGAEGFASGFMTVLGMISPPLKAIILLFQNFGPQIESLVSIIGSSLVPVFSTLGTTIGGIASAIMPAIQSALANLLPVISQIISTVANLVSSILPVLVSLFNQLAPFLVQIAELIGQIFATLSPMIAQLVSTLLPVIQNIVTVVMNVIQSVMPALISILNVVMSVIQALAPVIMDILSVVISVVSNIISTISPIISFIGMVISEIMAIISPIVTFIANIIATVINVIGTIIGTVTGIFSTVYSIISGAWSNISQFISSAINTISTIISGLTNTVGGVFNSIYSVVSSIMNRVRSYITGVFNGIKSAWNGLTSFVSGVFSGIGSAVNSLVSTVKGFVNGVIRGINAAIGLINMIPGVNIGRIPYLAHGTDDWQGGFAYMNEGGRGELTYLPNGAQVIPHDISVKYAKEAARANSGAESLDLSGLMEGMVIQVINNTNVDGTPLLEKASDFTIRKIWNQQKAVLKARGAFA